jgi:hypothetical protein
VQFLAALKFFISILPFIQSTILAVEKIHGPGNGPTKLDKALGVISALLPGHDVETVSSVKELLPHVIGHSVELMNDSGDLPKSPV